MKQLLARIRSQLAEVRRRAIEKDLFFTFYPLDVVLSSHIAGSAIPSPVHTVAIEDDGPRTVGARLVAKLLPHIEELKPAGDNEPCYSQNRQRNVARNVRSIGGDGPKDECAEKDY
jgi:hypothetical protein